MKLIIFLLLLGVLALPAAGSTVDSWTRVDIPGHNLTLNYTSSFNVSKNDTLGISIKNVGNESFNDTITINEINVSDTSASKSEGRWTGSVTVTPNSSETIIFPLNITTDAEITVDIIIYYNVMSESRALNVAAHYPGTIIPPAIISWSNSKTNNNDLTLTIDTGEVVRFNSTANQAIKTWNWFKDGASQSVNHDNFSTSWEAPGTKILSLNATNVNGTSNTVTWTVVVQAPEKGAPRIISWGNSKTGDNTLTLTINTGETVKFNVTANQTIVAWSWTLNQNGLTNLSGKLDYAFNDDGFYKVAVNGSNANGITQNVVWNVTVLEKEPGEKNLTILSWHPQVVDYVYVNDTVNETITYSITTAEPMAEINWTVDGASVTGSVDGNTAFLTHTWDNLSLGFHTVIFRGNNTGSMVEFRWYVNIYEIGRYAGGSIFDVIDDALENHITEIKIRIFKYKTAKHSGNVEFAAQKVNILHDEIAKRQMTREALRLEFKAGNITIDEYVSAMKAAQRDAKYNMKFAKEMAKIAKEDMKDERLGMEFEKISEIASNRDEGELKEKWKEGDEGAKVDKYKKKIEEKKNELNEKMQKIKDKQKKHEND